ncbi:MAG: hypothetical protein HQK83_01120 [Fibrobacteria bacterium]|nr:hypothetical protein [Fibrobacteria bacterium]
MSNLFFRYRGGVIYIWAITLFLCACFSNHTFNGNGLFIVLLGALIRFTSAMYIGSHSNGTAITARAFTNRGPYALVRNPLYVANLLSCEGILIYTNCLSPFIHISIISALFFFYHTIVTEEEKLLHAELKTDFTDYCVKVPRWIPWKVSIESWSGQIWQPLQSFTSVLRAQSLNISKPFLFVILLSFCR